MSDDNSIQKKRKMKWNTSYSNMSTAEAEKRLGLRIRSLKTIPVDEMLKRENGQHRLEEDDVTLQTKRKVYEQIVQYLEIEGEPTEADPDFKEGNINHLVYATISPILRDFRRKTGRKSIQLRSEKVIVSTDGKTGGTEEFVVMDLISVSEESFVFIVEAKKSSFGEAMKQCLLAMKDARDNNGGGVMYGFVTTGESWRMFRYDGISFEKTEKMDVLFETMGENEERWMKDYSVLVDCMDIALDKGGIDNNKVAVRK
ncbi:hypothetical protein EV426DRAFT_601366 [Tirmania nivea]|nr:hypothetical protein EV426DRAFT_601366 [Tirmania nivea]